MATIFLCVWLVLISSVYSEQITNLEPIITWTNNNGINFLGDIKDQKNTGMCWAFSTASYLEATYNIITRNKLMLSPEQIGDNIYDFYQNNDYQDDIFKSCKQTVLYYPRPSLNGGFQKCALYYVSKKGIMTEYEYSFTNGGEYPQRYNLSRVTPIGVSDIETMDLSQLSQSEIISNLLVSIRSGVILISVKATNNAITDDILITRSTDHAVLMTGLYQSMVTGEYYIEYQNSWGRGYGIKGMFYLRVTQNETFINNYGFLTNFVDATVFSTYAQGTSFTIDKKTIEAIESNTANAQLELSNLQSDNKKYYVASITLLSIIFVIVSIYGIIKLFYFVKNCKTENKNDTGNHNIQLTLNQQV